MEIFKEECCTSCTGISRFGICDDSNNQPAYIDQHDPTKWIATVTNRIQAAVHFRAIDNCIPMVGADGRDLQRCDGVLQYKEKFHFVELKERKRGDWQSKGFKQLRETIKLFREHFPNTLTSQIKAQLCNSQKPSVNTLRTQQLDAFYNDTGVRDVILETEIEIS